MNCAVHMEAEAAGYCRNCGKALCTQCTREIRGAMYCEPCLSAMVAQRRLRRRQPDKSLARIWDWDGSLGWGRSATESM